jgi:hypothetical protein
MHTNENAIIYNISICNMFLLTISVRLLWLLSVIRILGNRPFKPYLNIYYGLF